MKFTRKLKAVGLAAASILLFAGPASALTVDTYVDSYNSQNSGAQTTEDWVSGILGSTVTLSGDWAFTMVADGSGQWYVDVDPNTPGYFVLKFGTGPSNIDTFLFQNIGELTKLVWTDAQVNGLSANGGRLSHVRFTESTSVPEPTSLALLGLGLAGLGLARRRRS